MSQTTASIRFHLYQNRCHPKCWKSSFFFHHPTSTFPLCIIRSDSKLSSFVISDYIFDYCKLKIRMSKNIAHKARMLTKKRMIERMILHADRFFYLYYSAGIDPCTKNKIPSPLLQSISQSIQIQIIDWWVYEKTCESKKFRSTSVRVKTNFQRVHTI